MESYYRDGKYQNNMVSEKHLKDLNAHLPEWVKRFVELYTSDAKHRISEKDSN